MSVRSLETLDADAGHYDVCIVGSGPAGMTVAAELAHTGIRLCVLESGQEKKTRFADDLRNVESDGLSIKERSRERLLGGSSETWGNVSSLLDPEDMEPRTYANMDGWPISYTDMMPFLRGAAERYRFPHPSLFEPQGFVSLKSDDSYKPEWQALSEKAFFIPQERFQFGRDLRHIFDQPDVDLILDATVVKIDSQTTNGKQTIVGLHVKDSQDREYVVKAKTFVLAAGTIENIRLLLNSSTEGGTAIGNAHDQVGRYFMNHPKGYTGKVHFSKPVRRPSVYFWRKYKDGFIGYVGLRMCRSIQQERQLLNPYLRLEPFFPWTGKFVTAMLFKFGTLPKALGVMLLRLAYGFNPPVRTARIRSFLDMEPREDNRILLSEKKDVFGSRIPLVRYSLSDRDRASVIALHDLLDEELRRTNTGYLEKETEKLSSFEHEDSSHHLGGTRMGVSPESSVVNRDLRLHDVNNLYIVGGSVFPSGGSANPTMTIVALAIRLAEHLKQL